MTNDFKYTKIWLLHVCFHSALLVNWKQLNVTSEMFKVNAVQATEWACLLSFIHLCHVYWAPTMCQKHVNHRDEWVSTIHRINLVFGTVVLFWSNVLNLCQGSWLTFNSKPNRSIYFWKWIRFGLNNIKTCHTQTGWEFDHQNHMVSPGMLVLMLGPPRLPRSMGFSVNCLFVPQFVRLECWLWIRVQRPESSMVHQH